MSAEELRQQLVADLERSRAMLLTAIEGLDEEAVSQPGPDGWSVKDHLNHLTACDELRFQEIRRISRGGRGAYTGILGEDMDRWNDIIIRQRRALPLTQALSDLHAARELVLEAIAAAPERALKAENYTNYPVNGSIPHDVSHARMISECLQREAV